MKLKYSSFSSNTASVVYKSWQTGQNISTLIVKQCWLSMVMWWWVAPSIQFLCEEICQTCQSCNNILFIRHDVTKHMMIHCSVHTQLCLKHIFSYYAMFESKKPKKSHFRYSRMGKQKIIQSPQKITKHQTGDKLLLEIPRA